jgi:hypothetical protein
MGVVVGLTFMFGSGTCWALGFGWDELRPAQRLLMFSSLVTLALNVADPLLAGVWGKAAFDAVGPLLLIGWAHVGPGLLHALSWRSTSLLDE